MRKLSEGQFALGGLAVLAVWLLVVLPLLHRDPQQTPQVKAEQHSQVSVKGEQEGHASRHADEAEEGTEFWPPVSGYRLKITDTMLVAFTLGLTVFTGLLWRSTDKLWEAGERQLKLGREALVADQRAWLVVTDFHIKSFQFGEVVNGAADATAYGIVKVTNVGRTPALNVDLQLTMLGNYSSSAEAIRDHSARYLAAALEGRMVAAGESIEEEFDVRASAADLYRYGGSRGSRALRPLIVGCLTYQILQYSELRQTGFAFRPERADGGRIWTRDGDLDANDMRASAASGGFAT